MIPKRSLYDDYKLANSTAIPMYEGSTADAALQVGQYEQGQYDVARTMGDNISGNLDAIRNLPGDTVTANALRNDTADTLSGYAKGKNWEDRVEDVRQLGTNFANRSAELAQPLKDYTDWQKNVLDNKDNNLTPTQKDGLKIAAMNAYTPLVKTGSGRLVGSFQAPDVAKNLDTNEFVDKAMKDAAEKIAGTKATIDNDGTVKDMYGKKVTQMTPEHIRSIINGAATNSDEFKAFNNQEGTIAGAHGTNTIYSALSPLVKPTVDALIAKGYSTKDAISTTMQFNRAGTNTNMARGEVYRDMENYALNKYTKNNVETENEHVADKPSDKGPLSGAQLVQDKVDNFTNRYPTIAAMDKAKTDAVTQQTTAATQVDLAKNTAKRWYDSKHGTGAFSKLGTNNESAIQEYYNSPEAISGGAQYSNLQAARKNYSDATTKQNEVSGISDYVNDYTLGQMGTSLSERKAEAQKDIIAGIGSGTGKVTVTLDGTKSKVARDQLSQMVKQGVYTDSYTDDGQSMVKFKLPDGKELSLNGGDIGSGTPLGNAVDLYANKGNDMHTNKTKYLKDALANYSQASPLVTAPDDTSPSGKSYVSNAENAIAGAEKVYYDAAGHVITDTDLIKKYDNRIEARKFTYNGTYTNSKEGQNTMVKISVHPDKEADKNEEPVTLRVGLKSSTLAPDQANLLEKESKDATGQIVDASKYEMSKALRPGSAYNRLSQSPSVGKVVSIYQKNANGSKGNLILSGEKATENGVPKLVVRDNNGNLIDRLSDQSSLGALIDDKFTGNPNVIVDYK